MYPESTYRNNQNITFEFIFQNINYNSKFEMNFILVFQNHLKTLHIFKLCSTFYDNVLRSCS